MRPRVNPGWKVDRTRGMPQYRRMDPVLDFVLQCDAAGARMGVKRTTLSSFLFRDGKRLDELASGKSDIGARRVRQAQRDLESTPECRLALRSAKHTSSPLG